MIKKISFFLNFIIIFYLFTNLNCINHPKKNIEEKYIYLNINGENIFNTQFDFAEPFFEGLGCVLNKNQFGFINQRNEYVIKPQYEYAISFQEGYAIIGYNKKLGYININGELVSKPEYKSASSFINGYACVSYNGKEFGYINKFNKFITEPIFSNISFVSEGLINVEYNSKWGYLDTNGNIIIDFIYEDATPFFEERAFICKNNKWGIINKEGKIIIEPVFDNIDMQYEYSILSLYRNKIIFLDNDEEYNDLHISNKGLRFLNNLAIVKKNDKFGFIRRDGTIQVEIKYDLAYPNTTKYLHVCVKTNNEWQSILLNQNGEYIHSFEKKYNISQFINNNAIIHNNEIKKTGIINIDNSFLIPIEYDNIFLFEDNFALFENNNKFGYLNSQGEIIIQPIYSFATPFSDGFAVAIIKV